MIDLEPATTALSQVLDGIRDDQLPGATPCGGTTVAGLLDHLGGLALAFTDAATKSVPPGGGHAPVADASHLPDDWRTVFPGRLELLAASWRVPDAWEGMTEAGPVTMPGSVAGLVALNEVVVHGWDLAVSTGQRFAVGPDQVAAAREFVASAVKESPQGTPGLFGPPVDFSEDAPALDQLVALAGRSPSWRPS